ARQLRWPVGTVKTRLTRARALLRRRLTGRGVTLSVGALAATLSSGAASAQVPAQLTAPTVQAAPGHAAGAAGAGISASVTALVEEMLKELFLARMKATGLALVMLAAVVVGVGAVAGRTNREGPPAGLSEPGARGRAGLLEGPPIGQRP